MNPGHVPVKFEKEDSLLWIEASQTQMMNTSAERNTTFHKKKVYMEYAKFVKRYLQAKEYLKNRQVLDSFHCIVYSLQHWARLAVMECKDNSHLELSIWEQMKQIDPSVHKLYEELITSQEPLEKRMELLLLAFDFAVLSKMENSVQFILEIVRSRKSPWTVEEILDHPDIADREFEIFPVLDKMVNRALIKERFIERAGSNEKCYSVY